MDANVQTVESDRVILAVQTQALVDQVAIHQVTIPPETSPATENAHFQNLVARVHKHCGGHAPVVMTACASGYTVLIGASLPKSSDMNIWMNELWKRLMDLQMHTGEIEMAVSGRRPFQLQFLSVPVDPAKCPLHKVLEKIEQCTKELLSS